MNKKDLISKIKTLTDLTDTERAHLIELVNTKKKYGLVWEDKPEDVEEQLRSMLPVLNEVKEKAIVNGDENPNHILIEGDNLHALTALTFTHEDKIDVIYIDPPYNTGNKDFKYNDSFVDKEDSFRHSKWLSFMEKRLRIAKRLLRDNGVIFISIDENECYQLKLLCDEIYSSNNFIADNIWKSKSGGAGDASFIATDTENILVYAKNKNLLSLGKDGEATITTSYNRTEPDGRKYALDRLDKQSLGYQKTLDFPITDKNGKVYIVEHKDPNNKVARWRWGKKTVEDRFDELVFENNYVYTKNYETSDGSTPRNLLIEERFGRTRTGKTELFSIIGANNMTAPKPSRLIQYILSLFPDNNFTFLDFFAGSGTSLDALMKLNSIDGGLRRGIICTNNEGNICNEITYPRVSNIINGYTSKGNNQVELFNEKLSLTNIKKSNKILEKIEKIKKENELNYSKTKLDIKDGNITLWGLLEINNKIEGLKSNNLRYYKAEFVPSERTEINRRKLTQESTDLLCIKEDCYGNVSKEFELNEKDVKLFTNGLGKYMLVVYHSRNQMEVIEKLTAIISTIATKEKIKLYAFSPEKETIEEDFFSVADKIEAVPLPDSIYNAYRATFRTLKLDKKQTATVASQTTEQE
jgi:adenine-specific DNA-methyltransferase